MKYLFVSSLIFIISCSRFPFEHLKRDPSSYLTSFEHIQSHLGESRPFPGNDPLDLATSLEALQETYGEKDFISIYNQNLPSVVKAHNKLVLNLLKAERETNGKKAGYLTSDEAISVSNLVRFSRNEKLKRVYDPSGKEGFCYARAILSHVQAIKAGVDPSSVKKIWAVGNVLGYPFHVGTLVKSEKGWLIIDSSFFPNGGTVEEWIERFSLTSNGKDNMFFIADGDRFAQNSPAKYSAIDFFNTSGNDYNLERDFYKGYFRDFFEDIEKQELSTFPKRAAHANERRIIGQIKTLRLLYEAYPATYSKAQWSELFDEAEDRYLKLFPNFSEEKIEVLKAVDDLIVLGKHLSKNIDRYSIAQNLSIELAIEELFNDPEAIVRGEFKKFPDELIIPKLKAYFSLNLQKPNGSLAKYYLGENKIDKNYPDFEFLMSNILSTGNHETHLETMLLKKLEGINEDWTIKLLITHLRISYPDNYKTALSVLKKLPIENLIPHLKTLIESSNIQMSGVEELIKYLLSEKKIMSTHPAFKDMITHILTSKKFSIGVEVLAIGSLESNLDEWAIKLLIRHVSSPNKMSNEAALPIVKKIPEHLVIPFLKKIFQNSNYSCGGSEQLARYFLVNNRIPSTHPLFEELMTIILKSNGYTESLEYDLLKKLDGVNEPWAIEILKYHASKTGKKNAGLAIELIRKLPKHLTDCDQAMRSFLIH